MRHMTITQGEIAQLLDLRLREYTVEPTRFKPNHGRLWCLFGRKENVGKLKLMAELPGNFVIEADVELADFAKNGQEAAGTVVAAVREMHMAGAMRRHGERNLIAKTMQHLKEARA